MIEQPDLMDTSMLFLGIDLGWQSQPSGVCCLQWTAAGLDLVTLDRLADPAAVLAWVDGCLPANTMGGIAVDAPILIPNQTGMRVCDRLAHRHFGRYHAGCYPANRSLPFAERTLAFSHSLEERGFAHAPEIQPRQPQRFQIEMFPHPAMVRLFRLPRILKYKKGRIADRQAALNQLRQCILTHLPAHDPPLHLTEASFPPVPTTGATLKALEDQLDSVICAYAAAYWWQWGSARNQVLGTAATGYIVIPDPDGVAQPLL